MPELEQEGSFEETRRAFLSQLGVNQFVIDADKIETEVQEYAHWLEYIKEIKGGEPPYNATCMWNAMKGEKFKKLNGTFMKLIEKLPLNKICYLLATNEELYTHVCNSCHQSQYIGMSNYYQA